MSETHSYQNKQHLTESMRRELAAQRDRDSEKGHKGDFLKVCKELIATGIEQAELVEMVNQVIAETRLSFNPVSVEMIFEVIDEEYKVKARDEKEERYAIGQMRRLIAGFYQLFEDEGPKQRTENEMVAAIFLALQNTGLGTDDIEQGQQKIRAMLIEAGLVH